LAIYKLYLGKLELLGCSRCCSCVWCFFVGMCVEVYVFRART